MAKREKKSPDLADFISAGYPVLFMRTVEPSEAEKKVREALEELEMGSIRFGVWKATTGMELGRADGSVRPSSAHNATDFLEALRYVSGAQENDPIVVVFHNVRQFIGHYQNIQQLLDTAHAARLSGSTVVLVGPHLELPPELRNVITFIDLPLPSQDQIKEQYESITRAYADQVTLPKDKDARDQLLIEAARAAVGLDTLGAENALALSLGTAERIDIKIIQQQKEQEVRKSDVLEFFSHEETLDNVGGFAYFKEWLERRSRAFSHEAREYGLPYPKGMLIVGPAGCGKSLVAKASASFLKLPLLRLDMGKVFRSLVGESEATIRMALQVAEAVSPVVLWMDEIEKGLAGAKGSGELDSGVTSRVVSTILTWRQETRYPVMLVATANDVTTLPAMVYRKGRLDEVWATDLPTAEEREEIFKIHLRKRKRDPDKFKAELLAKHTPDFTGAEIEGCIEDAMFTAFDVDTEVNTGHILQSIRETVPQAQRNREELEAIREWASTRARKVSGGEPAEQSPAGKAKVRNIRNIKKKNQEV